MLLRSDSSTTDLSGAQSLVENLDERTEKKRIYYSSSLIYRKNDGPVGAGSAGSIKK